MSRKRTGATIIELMVTISIFLVVSTAVVALMQHAQVITVWGEKKNDALRQNREIMRRIGLVLRQAIPRPAFGTTLSEPPIISVTTVARNQDPDQDPFPANHNERLDYWASTEDARRSVNSTGFPAAIYPAPTSYDPRTSAMDVPNNYSRLRLEWSQTTGELYLRLMSNDGATVLATRNLVTTVVGPDGQRTTPIRCVDLRQDPSTATVGLYLETRSRDRNSKFQERRYGSDTQFNIPAWQ